MQFVLFLFKAQFSPLSLPAFSFLRSIKSIWTIFLYQLLLPRVLDVRLLCKYGTLPGSSIPSHYPFLFCSKFILKFITRALKKKKPWGWIVSVVWWIFDNESFVVILLYFFVYSCCYNSFCFANMNYVTMLLDMQTKERE